MERLKNAFKAQLEAWHKKREAHEVAEKERAEAPWKDVPAESVDHPFYAE